MNNERFTNGPTTPPASPHSDTEALQKTRLERRSFLKGAGALSAAGALMPAKLLMKGTANDEDSEDRLTRGDIAILRFLAAAEIIETDLWQQYNELGGIQDKEVPGGSGSQLYTEALQRLDGDMPQYIHDNTEDEFTHQDFINAYLASKGADRVNLDQFRTLPSSKATGAQQIGRITNLMKLTVDTSWWTRYRSRKQNPDLDPGFKFAPAIPGLLAGQFPAIPRTDADLMPHEHIQAIANTAGFHFGFIEQGGTSLYPSLAQRVTNPEVLRILLAIGPTEMAHFQTWHDKAGNIEVLTDPTNRLVFPDLNAPPLGGEDFQTNLIMPEPIPFLSRKFPVCSVIRPTETKGAATAAAQSLVADGLFIGQPKQFFELLRDLAEGADEARRNTNTFAA